MSEQLSGQGNMALTIGGRGLPGASSLAKLLEEKRGRRNDRNLPSLTEDQILKWADLHKNRTGDWPKSLSGPIADAPGETWANVNAALSQGARGFLRGSSLARLLEENRGVRNVQNLPSLTVEQILNWADLYKDQIGNCPNQKSGPISDAPGETWANVNANLFQGGRGLPGGSSLPKLLEEKRGLPNRLNRPLTEDQILQWADLHKQRTGKWPKVTSGYIADTDGETWVGMHRTLSRGGRGLPGGSSLAKLLAEHRGMRNRGNLSQLSNEQILIWADSYRERTGDWPKPTSGAIPDAPGETWDNVQNALFSGLRGFPGGLTLAQLLQAERGVRNMKALPGLTEDQILVWAEAYYRQNGSWPKKDSGPIDSAPGETWNGVQIALLRGRRGLSGGSSLARLIKERYSNSPS